jgi:uncharacterized membrane protein
MIAVGLVAAMFWTARAFTSRKVSLAAAALCAGSPIVLQYAQEVRVCVCRPRSNPGHRRDGQGVTAA